MADSQHTLHLTAKLDTSEVQQKIDQLNSGRAGGPSAESASSQASGISNLQNSLSRLSQAASSLSQAGRLLQQAARLQMQLQGQGQAAPAQDKSLAGDLAVAKALQAAKTAEKVVKTADQKWPMGMRGAVQITPDMTGTQLMQRIRIRNVQLGEERLAERLKAAGITHQQLLDAARGDIPQVPKQKISPEFAAFRRVLAAAGMQRLIGEGQQLNAIAGGEAMSPWANLASNVGTGMLMGSAAGPMGAFAGAAGGAVLSFLQQFGELLRISNQKLEEWNSGVQQASQFLKSRKQFRQTEGFQSAMQMASGQKPDVSGITSQRSQLISRYAELQKQLDMQEKLARSGQVAANAPELQRELEQVTAQIRQIDSVLKQISERKRAEAESTAKVARNVDEQLKALDRFAEARENLRQFQAQQAAQELDKAELFQNYGIYGSNARESRNELVKTLQQAKAETDPKKQASLLEQAASARASWQFSLGQQDFFKSGLVQLLQEQLSKLTPADLTPVTSLGQYGYGMGEVNDNVIRQTRIWEEQADLQRQIRDILQDKTFEAHYSN